MAQHPSFLFLLLISIGVYQLEQVFNADGTGLFWNRMANKIYVFKSHKSASGFRVARLFDEVTYTLQIAKLCALKNKNKENLLMCKQKGLGYSRCFD